MLEAVRSVGAYQDLLAQLETHSLVEGLGVLRAARLPILAALYADLNRPILYITSRSDTLLTILDELTFWDKDLSKLSFPEPTPLFYEQAAWGKAVRRDRIQALATLSTYHLPGIYSPEKPPVMVTSIRALMARTLPRRDFLVSTRQIRVGQVSKPEELLRRWVDIGYEPADVVVEPGQFARRGGIVDIWPVVETLPTRLDFFGDELDTLRRFDPATQRTVKKLETLLITPAMEVLPGKAQKVALEENERLDEFYLPVVHPAQATLLDYLPSDALVVVDNLDRVQLMAAEIEEQAVKFRQESIVEGTLPGDFPVPYLSWSEIEDSLGDKQWFEMGRLTAADETAFSTAFMPEPRFGGRLKEVMDYLGAACQAGERVEVVSRQAPRLKDLWVDREGYLELKTHPSFHEASLSDGFSIKASPDTAFHLLTDSEIFGWERPKPRKKPQTMAKSPEAVYADFKSGDWVVHVDYGIGRFTGMVSKVFEGVEREYLCVEYDAGDQLFVPVHQADRLTRYIGTDGQEPHPTRLGTQEWSTAKQRVREAVLEIAEDLLDLYARRKVVKGYAFQEDTPWQKELEASFPYIETEDQLQAIHNVKHDMEAPRPMDRLLCGDVGYGKTEVALRAAFKAVMDGKQVALLVPTTVLAQQHYETFWRRLAPFPVVVEMLSRFRTPKEQQEILRRLREGGVDIVIGTHRLVQEDVQFKDLGLVIIDEEQRFGVTHKEYLKNLRTEVDVLTMTATPIPRTLYMALTGVRDISMINTPPEERLPIITHVGPYSPKLVRQAVLRELERGGQVFFVHNRVQTIRAMESHLLKLVPEAQVGIGHGQMPEKELSAVMHRFTNGDIDVLLCTSIIESGLDIPNANTLIVDRADMFGLAQLYQLRGRVGRAAQRAYAYFFRHRRRPPTQEGLERLEVISENTQLGSGYSIAMRDLEMRGAGEFLGTRQHGYIASVGFHLYTRLLAQAVRELQKVKGLTDDLTKQKEILRASRMPVSVDLPQTIGIPTAYVSNQSIRLQLYRRIADMENLTEVDALEEEFEDRFGSMPEPIRNLLYQMRIKLLAEQIGLSSVTFEGEQFVLRFPPLPEGVADRRLPRISFNARVGKNAYWIPQLREADWQDRLLQILLSIHESH